METVSKIFFCKFEKLESSADFLLMSGSRRQRFFPEWRTSDGGKKSFHWNGSPYLVSNGQTRLGQAMGDGFKTLPKLVSLFETKFSLCFSLKQFSTEQCDFWWADEPTQTIIWLLLFGIPIKLVKLKLWRYSKANHEAKNIGHCWAEYSGQSQKCSMITFYGIMMLSS